MLKGKFHTITAQEMLCNGKGVGVYDKINGCRCKCKDGWSGEGCTKPECPKTENGVCSGKGDVVFAPDGKCKCKCKAGWKGYFS